jgi:hypothetical protein
MSVALRQLTVPQDEQDAADRGGWEMKEMSLWHKNVASLIAQGIPRGTIANMMGCSETHVTRLAKQPLMRAYIQELSEFAGIQLEAQFAKTVTAIGDVLENGDHKSKIAAARLQSELTGRVGSRTNSSEVKPNAEDRLIGLSERLVGLLENKMADDRVTVHESENLQVEDAIFSERNEAGMCTGQQEHESAQNAGGGLHDPEGWEGGEVGKE